MKVSDIPRSPPPAARAGSAGGGAHAQGASMLSTTSQQEGAERDEPEEGAGGDAIRDTRASARRGDCREQYDVMSRSTWVGNHNNANI